jgi:hypothetical protein
MKQSFCLIWSASGKLPPRKPNRTQQGLGGLFGGGAKIDPKFRQSAGRAISARLCELDGGDWPLSMVTSDRNS